VTRRTTAMMTMISSGNDMWSSFDSRKITKMNTC
jgi:hypothetical protein